MKICSPFLESHITYCINIQEHFLISPYHLKTILLLSWYWFHPANKNIIIILKEYTATPAINQGHWEFMCINEMWKGGFSNICIEHEDVFNKLQIKLCGIIDYCCRILLYNKIVWAKNISKIWWTGV